MHEDRLVPANDLCTQKDIVERLGMNPQTVANLASGRRRTSGFPRPVCGRGSRGIWLWSEVEAWWQQLPSVQSTEHTSYRPSYRKKRAA